MQAGHRANPRIRVASQFSLFFQRAPAAGVRPADPPPDVVFSVFVGDAARRDPVGHHFHRAAGLGIFVGGQVPHRPQIQRRRLQEPEPFRNVSRHPHVHVAADAVHDECPARASGLRLLGVQDVGQTQQGPEGVGRAVPQTQPQRRVQHAQRDRLAQLESRPGYGRAVLL